LSSKVLADTSIAVGPEAAAPRKARKGRRPPTLDESFDARAGELAAAITRAPDGRPMVRADVRAQLRARLAGLAAVAPRLADRLESHASARLLFLYAKLPKVQRLGMEKTRPSELEVRAWAHYAAASADPGGIEDRLADGSVSPEDREVMQALYPERYAAIVGAIMERLPSLRVKLGHQQRLALSIFTGVPVDPAMEPRILATLQAQFANEPGSEGGTQAPTPQPAFGSVTKPEPTPAQAHASA
jgi:hypothetical protein